MAAGFEFDNGPKNYEDALSLRDALAKGIELFAAAFGRIYRGNVVDAYATIFAGYSPKYVLKAAQRIARSGSAAPSPREWLSVADGCAMADGAYHDTPWTVPPWAVRIYPFKNERTGEYEYGTDKHGGFYWFPGARHQRPTEYGETHAFNEWGIASITGHLRLCPKGFLVWCPIGQTFEAQPDWDRIGPDIIGRWKQIAHKVAERAIPGSPIDGVRTLAQSLMQSIGGVS